jgi:transposase-like protein
MAPRCSICGRADRIAIDADIAAGASSLASIAARYGVSKSALIRHRDNHGAEQTAAENTPTAVTVRQRIRPASAADSSTAEPSNDDEITAGSCEAVEPTTARLREVASLLARGLSRAEIAARYGVHVDTVTAWHRTIRERGILRVKTTSADEIIATLLHSQAQRSRALWSIFHDAQAKGLPRVAVTALDGLRKEDRHVFEIASGIGAFDQFKLAAEKPLGRRYGEEELEALQDLAADLVRAFAQGDDCPRIELGTTDLSDDQLEADAHGEPEHAPHDDPEPLF